MSRRPMLTERYNQIGRKWRGRFFWELAISIVGLAGLRGYFAGDMAGGASDHGELVSLQRLLP